MHAAQETGAVLASYRDRLEVCAPTAREPEAGTGQRTALVQDVLQGLHGSCR